MLVTYVCKKPKQNLGLVVLEKTSQLQTTLGYKYKPFSVIKFCELRRSFTFLSATLLCQNYNTYTPHDNTFM